MRHTTPRPTTPKDWARRWAAEIGGWVLLVVGALALVLPGPGTLLIAAGLVLLSTQYAWAERLMHPLTAKALALASQGVKSWPRIMFSVLGALTMMTIGILWGIGFAVPDWWPIDERWWLVGGWATGVTLIASGSIALGLIAYSYVRFRPRAAVSP